MAAFTTLTTLSGAIASAVDYAQKLDAAPDSVLYEEFRAASRGVGAYDSVDGEAAALERLAGVCLQIAGRRKTWRVP